jgi:FMN reductase
MLNQRPYLVAIGGTMRQGSSTEKALRFALEVARDRGAETILFSGAELDLPMYAPERPLRTPAAQRLIEALRLADGVIIGSPGYHGGPSGFVKNALDYVEDMREDARPYLSGRAVGCIATAAGWQAAVATLASLRSVVHALRGWPTPLGVCIAGSEPAFAPDGKCVSPAVQGQLTAMVLEVLELATLRQAARHAVVEDKHALA